MNLVQIKERVMTLNKKTVFLIAIGVGILACLLLTNSRGIWSVSSFIAISIGRFPRSPRVGSALFNGFTYILSSGFVLIMAITAIESLVFGAVAGGAVGLLGGYLGMVRILGIKFFLFFTNPVIIIFPLLCGLYGFVIGKLCEAKVKTPDVAKTQSIKKVFFTAFIASFLMRLAPLIVVTPRFPMGLERYPLPYFLRNISGYEETMAVNALLPLAEGLIVGILCAVAAARVSIMKAVRSVSTSGGNATTGENTITGELIKCSACGKEYYYKADKCPNCGKRSQRDVKAQKIYYIIFGIIILAVVIWACVFLSGVFNDSMDFINSRESSIPDKF